MRSGVPVHCSRVLVLALRWLLSLALLTAVSTSLHAAAAEAQCPLSVDREELPQLSIPQRPDSLPPPGRIPLSPPTTVRSEVPWQLCASAPPPAEIMRPEHVGTRVHLPRRHHPTQADDDG